HWLEKMTEVERVGDKHICYDRYSISGCSMFKQFFSAGEVIGQFVERVGEIGSKMKYHDCYR
ncbi:hypothetical protein, partial [Bacteroides caccae]|uniref:hypothetical protein n=1 Tax=Bacteroides caccae TaxID=47678 RepID=UPI0032EBC5C0